MSVLEGALSYAELEQIRDILVLHYTATERDDTPFWRHCRAIDRPDSMRRRMDMYESSGAIYIDAGDVFREPSALLTRYPVQQVYVKRVRRATACGRRAKVAAFRQRQRDG